MKQSAKAYTFLFKVEDTSRIINEIKFTAANVRMCERERVKLCLKENFNEENLIVAIVTRKNVDCIFLTIIIEARSYHFKERLIFLSTTFLFELVKI